jgi:hypothetical protein
MRGKIFAAHDDSDGLQCKGAKIVFFVGVFASWREMPFLADWGLGRFVAAPGGFPVAEVFGQMAALCRDAATVGKFLHGGNYSMG